MIIDWGDIIKEGLKLVVPVVGIVAPLAYQQQKAIRDARAEAKLAREERLAAAKKVDEVATKVDGHLTALTASLAKAATTNVALTIEADRLNEGTTTEPASQTPVASDGGVSREIDGSYTLTDRRRPEAPE